MSEGELPADGGRISSRVEGRAWQGGGERRSGTAPTDDNAGRREPSAREPGLHPPAALQPTQPAGWPTARYELAVNGTPQPVADAWIGESLLFVLRERLGFNAVKDGCSEGECGACTVLMDGQPTTACLVPAVTAVGRPIETPEVHAVPQPDPIATALALHAGAGCGFCLPGIGMELRALLARNAAPSASAIRESLSGHRCRCLPPERFIAAADEAARALARARPQAHVPLQDSGEYELPHVPAQARPGSRAGEQAGVPA